MVCGNRSWWIIHSFVHLFLALVPLLCSTVPPKSILQSHLLHAFPNFYFHLPNSLLPPSIVLKPNTIRQIRQIPSLPKGFPPKSVCDRLTFASIARIVRIFSIFSLFIYLFVQGCYFNQFDSLFNWNIYNNTYILLWDSKGLILSDNRLSDFKQPAMSKFTSLI